MNKLLFFAIALLTLVSCSSTDPSNIKKELGHKEEKYSYSDKNGQFMLRSMAGFNKKEKSFFTKQSLEMLNKTQDNSLEQSIAFSQLGMVKKRRMILRPKNSEYNVWFDGKKFSSKLKVIPAKKMVELTMESPEVKWNGVKQFKFPSTKIPTCFFSQIVECAKVMGLLKTQKKMSFYVLWEGYPYLNETFSDFPMELFSRAELEYEGKLNQDEKRFSLQVAGQSIAYILDKNNKLKKMFWISQGISMVSKSYKESAKEEEDNSVPANE
jgi:hypothetical protein